MDKNTAIVLIVLIIAIGIIAAIFAWFWMYIPYMRGYYDNHADPDTMHGY